MQLAEVREDMVELAGKKVRHVRMWERQKALLMKRFEGSEEVEEGGREWDEEMRERVTKVGWMGRRRGHLKALSEGTWSLNREKMNAEFMEAEKRGGLGWGLKEREES